MFHAFLITWHVCKMSQQACNTQILPFCLHCSLMPHKAVQCMISHVCAGTLLSVLKVMRTQQLWMSAWAALGPWGWCRDKKTPLMFKRWLRRLQAGDVVSELTVSDIQECFTIPQVCSRCTLQSLPNTFTMRSKYQPDRQSSLTHQKLSLTCNQVVCLSVTRSRFSPALQPTSDLQLTSAISMGNCCSEADRLQRCVITLASK